MFSTSVLITSFILCDNHRECIFYVINVYYCFSVEFIKINKKVQYCFLEFEFAFSMKVVLMGF